MLGKILKKILYLAVLFFSLAFLSLGVAYSADGEYVYRASTEIKSELPGVTAGAQSGAFIFDQNIDAPAGRNGLQPNLKMQYNNQETDESNIAGYGWSFSIPYIQRLPKKGIDRLYDENYFYSSLSGEIVPIKLTDSTNGHYADKVETGGFLDYTFADNIWTVTDKTGTVYTFGKDAAGRQDDPNNANHAFKWMLQEIRDTNDNFVRYKYFKDNGQIYPARISYTGHGAEQGIYEVVFSHEARADAAIMYNAGFKMRTQYRISSITVNANGTWVKKYDLAYVLGDNNKRSLLGSITESGNKDGATITLPPTKFTYQQKEKGWAFGGYIAPDWGTWVGYQDKGQRIADITGDGLLDIFSSNDTDGTGNKIQKTFFVNNGNGGYTNASGGAPTPIYMANKDNGVRFGDVNGDGVLDFVYGFSLYSIVNPTKVFIKKNGETDWLVDENYKSPAIFVNRDASGMTADLSVRLADINGDGLADVLKFTPYIKEISINQGDGTWKSSDEYSIPQGYYMGSQTNSPNETVIMDVNGDGLEDFIYSGFSTASDSETKVQPVAKACLNIDGGKNYDCSFTLDAPSLSGIPNTYDGANVFLDVNGDGLVDFARGNGQKINDPLAVYINKGDGTGWAYDSEQTLPESLLKDFGGGNFVDNGLRIIDVNGDGLSDFLRLGGEGGNYIYLNKGAKADLLIHIDHNKGATTEVTYKTAQMFKKADGSQANPQLPFMMYVADKITTDDGMGNKATTNYQYEGGKNYFNNYLDKRFAGFQIINKTDALGNVTKQYFHQGDDTNSALGEYADHPAKINLMYREDLLDANGQLQAQTLNTFDVADLGNNRKYVFNSKTSKKSYDSTGAHKDSAASFEFNNVNGNLTKKTEWGEVLAQNDGTFTDVGADAKIHAYSYAGNGGSIIGLPSQETVTDLNGVKISETFSYYDNLPFGQASIGNKTKNRNWISGNLYADTQKTYNSFGLPLKLYDANNNVTTFVYDSYNLYPATITNALGQTVKYQYDYAVGKPNQTIDANNNKYETAFDPFGRVKQERVPDVNNPASLVTSAEYFYNDNSNPRVAQTKKYLDDATTVDSYSYVNGLDKTIQERTEAEDGFSVKDFTYNKLGLVQSETLAYFSAGSGYTPPTTNTKLYTNYTYDALKRVETIANAVGTTFNNYFNWKVSTTDAKGNTKDYYHDAFGRLIQVTEKITNQTSANYHTYYTYDGNNNLTKITDALGNVRNFGYDGLGRRISADDLHVEGDATFGVWNYTYDNNGNLKSQTDPKNQTVTYAYDALNRKISEDSATQAGVEVNYTHDVGCTNGVGRLCAVKNSDVNASYAYNALGQVTKETKTIDATNYVTQYTYDIAGNTKSIIYPDNSEVTNQYNSAGLLENISKKESTVGGFASVVNDFDYSPLGQVAYQQNANGTATTNTYDENQLYRLTRKVTTGYKQKLSDIKTVTTTQTFYSTAGDGSIYKSGASWDAAHDATSGSGVSAGFTYILTGPSKSTTNYFIYRSFLPFDTSSIPDDATVTSASLNVFPQSITNNDNDGDDFITVVQTSQANTSNLSIGDFDQAGDINNPVEGINASERKDMTGIATAKYLTLNLNFTGLGWISKTDVTKLGLREGHDVKNSAFTSSSTTTSQFSRISFSSSEYPGTTQDPYLTITYTQTTATNSLGFTTTTLQDLSYTYDAVGNITKIIDAGDLDTAKTSDYTYDDLYRLKTAIITNAKNNQNYTQTYAYDAIGNILNKSDIGNYLYAQTGYANPHAVTEAGNKKYTYDNNGNLVSDDATTYAWDYQNRLMSSGETATSTSASTAITTTTLVFYSTPGDGHIYKSNTSWDGAHDATYGSGASATATYLLTGPAKSTTNYFIYRSFLPFDTSPIPDDATIVSASLNVYAQSTTNHDNDGDDFITVLHASQSSAASLTTDDFDQVGSINSPSEGIDVSERKDLTNIATAKYLTFKFNANGQSWISKTGPTKLGLREGHDVVDSAFTSLSATDTRYNYLAISSGEFAGTTQDPYLSVTYTQSTTNTSTPAVVNKITYEYDESGQRTKKTANGTTTIYPFKHYEKEGNKITKYIYAGSNLVASIETSNGVEYIHADHLGSTSVITDTKGFVSKVLDYYPYGEKRTDEGTSTGNKQFIGQYYDEDTLLSYLNARYYDGARGQFISQDPVHLAIGSPGVEQLTGKRLQEVLADPQVLNSYSYAKNNPVVNKDPEGKYLETAFDVAMFGLSLNDFRERPGFWNGVGVLADGASLVLPIPAIVGGIRHADDAAKFLKGADKAGDVARGANRAADFAGISKQYNWGNPNLLKDHTRRHAADFGLATDNYAGYAQKGNEFITNKQYTNVFKEGKDTVYWNKDTNIAVYTNRNGQISSAYKLTNENKINDYKQRATKQQ